MSTTSALPRVVLKPRRARPFFGRHPWVLDSAIHHVQGDVADGDVVDLYSDQGQFIARGLFNASSRIRVRLYQWSTEQPLDETFWRQRLAAAIGWRQTTGYNDPAGACRLVASEADGLGGLIVDRYADQLVVQVNALAIALRLPMLIPLLAELTAPRGISLRADAAVARHEGLFRPTPDGGELLTEGPCWGTPADGPVFIEEHGLRYGVDLTGGQKTGFYLDQRENRRAAAAWLRGRNVLDICCYSGGFALCAARLGQAHVVTGVDSSHKAITLARANAQLNGIANVHFEQADSFAFLAAEAEAGRRHGAVILDPPKFASGQQAVEKALRAYHQLNRLAVDVLEPDGILITCSCSGHVKREDLLFVLAEVAARSGRPIQVLEQRGAAPDHPVAANCLESEYLKCFICRVL